VIPFRLVDLGVWWFRGRVVLPRIAFLSAVDLVVLHPWLIEMPWLCGPVFGAGASGHPDIIVLERTSHPDRRATNGDGQRKLPATLCPLAAIQASARSPPETSIAMASVLLAIYYRLTGRTGILGTQRENPVEVTSTGLRLSERCSQSVVVEDCANAEGIDQSGVDWVGQPQDHRLVCFGHVVGAHGHQDGLARFPRVERQRARRVDVVGAE
jgi:hypothetical protein